MASTHSGCQRGVRETDLPFSGLPTPVAADGRHHERRNEPLPGFLSIGLGGVGMDRSFVRLTPVGPQEDVDRRLSAALSGSGDRGSRKLMTLLHDQCTLLPTALHERERLEVVRRAVWQLGRFLTPADDIPPDVTSLLTQLLLRHGSFVFDVLLDVERPDASRFVFKVTPPHHPPLLGRVRTDKQHCASHLAEATDYTPLDMVDALNEYNRCMRDHWITMDRLKESINALELGWDRKQLDDLFRFIDMDYFLAINDHLPDEGSLRKMLITKDYVDMSLDQLDRLCPTVKWRRLLSDLIDRDVDQVERSERVHVYAAAYLEGACRDFLASPDVRQVYNTLLALYADDLYWNFVPNEAVQRRHCQSVTVHLMEDVASAAYLSSFTSTQLDSMKFRLAGVFDHLKSTLVRKLREIDFTDQTLRSELLNKVERVRIDLDNGMFLVRNPQTLDDRWKDFRLGDNFISSAVALVHRYRKKAIHLMAHA